MTSVTINSHFTDIMTSNVTTPRTSSIVSSSSSLGLPLELTSQLILIALYSVTTLVSVVGNLLVIVVFSCGSRSRTSSLRLFLISLAMADLVMAVFCMPFSFTMSMLKDWIFSAPMCPIVLFMQTLSVTASVATNVAIGVDRYCAVVRPLRAHTSAPKRRLVIILVWLLSALLSSVQLFVARVQTAPGGGRSYCMEVWPQPQHVYRQAYTSFLLLTNYFFPFGVLALTYGNVCHRLRRRSRPGNSDAARDQLQNKSTRKVK